MFAGVLCLVLLVGLHQLRVDLVVQLPTVPVELLLQLAALLDLQSHGLTFLNFLNASASIIFEGGIQACLAALARQLFLGGHKHGYAEKILVDLLVRIAVLIPAIVLLVCVVYELRCPIL